MKIILCIFALVVSFACEHTPEWTPQQRRAMQVRTFNASYRNVFLAIKDVLQDDGYQIKSQDYRGGLIVAKKEIDTTTKLFGFFVVEGDPSETTGVTFQVSFNLERVSKANVEARLTLSSIAKRRDGQHRAKEVVEPKTYQAIYRNLQVEIKRRQARGKG